MKAILNSDGSVQVQWVKMLVTNKKQQEFYTASTGYKPLSQIHNGTLFAFRRAIDSDNPLPNHLELCTEFEIKKLEDKYNSVQ